MTQLTYLSEAYVPKSFGYNIIQIGEDTNGAINKLVLEGEFQQADLTNKNKRRYTESLLTRETNKLKGQIQERGGLPMELDHPLPGNEPKDLQLAQRVTLKEACALITSLDMSNKIVYGKSEVVEENAYGMTLAGLVKRGWKPGVSSRGLGGRPTQDPRGFQLVPENYNMITYDYVSNPSNYNSVLNQIMESQMYQVEEESRPGNMRSMWSVLSDINDKHK